MGHSRRFGRVSTTVAVGTRVPRAPRTDPYGPNSGIRLPPRVSNGETTQLAACVSAPVTRFPGTVPGPCFANSHSPRPPPLAPPTPPSEWPWTYMFLAMLMLLFALEGAGRSLGLDARLRRQVPAVRDGKGLIGWFFSVAG